MGAILNKHLHEFGSEKHLVEFFLHPQHNGEDQCPILALQSSYGISYF